MTNLVLCGNQMNITFLTSFFFSRESTVPRICIATASPAKFDEAVVAAGLKPQPNASIKELLLKPTKYTDMEKSDDWTQILKDKLEGIFNEHLTL